MGLATGIGLGIQFSRGGGQSWESYWASQPEVLFFGLYSEISGGQMPNKVTGSSDYLTIAGSAGSETYQCPNTAPYIAADTDYIWFKTDETQRTATTAEMIGYDFTRTIVKYGNATPNAIEAIMILSSDVDTAKMRDDFDLSVWWDDTLSLYGSTKDNRGSGKSSWTPEALWESELVTYMTGLTTELSEDQKTKLNTFILALKSGLSITNLTDAFDWMPIYGGETSESSLKNLVKNAHHSTLHGLTGEPVFTAFEGFMGNVAFKRYISSNYNPHDDGDNFTLNSASFGVYIRTARDAASTYFHGSSDGTDEIRIAVRRGATVVRTILNAPSANYTNGTIADSLGLTTVLRNASDKQTSARDGAFLVTETDNSSVIPDLILFLLAQNVSGTASNFAEEQIAIAFAGRYFSEAELTVIYNAIEAYMDSNGKGVVA